MDASVKFTEVYNFERKQKILEYAHNIKFAIIPKTKTCIQQLQCKQPTVWKNYLSIYEAISQKYVL